MSVKKVLSWTFGRPVCGSLGRTIGVVPALLRERGKELHVRHRSLRGPQCDKANRRKA